MDDQCARSARHVAAAPSRDRSQAGNDPWRRRQAPTHRPPGSEQLWIHRFRRQGRDDRRGCSFRTRRRTSHDVDGYAHGRNAVDLDLNRTAARLNALVHGFLRVLPIISSCRRPDLLTASEVDRSRQTGVPLMDPSYIVQSTAHLSVRRELAGTPASLHVFSPAWRGVPFVP